MSDNLKLWNSVKTVDPKFVKDVNVGFKFSSVNAQWLKEIATKTWGPCGTGWGYDYEITRDDYSNGETVLTAHMDLWYIGEDGEAKHVRHCGVCKAATIPKGGVGLRVDEEATKKAVTNALSKTLSNLGFAADLWYDLYSQPGYKESAAATFEAERAAQHEENIRKRLVKVLEQTGADPDSPEEDLLCRFWSNGKHDAVDAFENIDVAREIVKAQSEMCSTIPVAKQLDKAREFSKGGA